MKLQKTDKETEKNMDQNANIEMHSETNRIKYQFFLIMIMASSLSTYFQSFNQQLSYYLVMGVLSLVMIIILTEKEMQKEFAVFIRKNRVILLAFLIYWAILLSHLLNNFSTANIEFTFGYLFSFLLVFFVLPLSIYNSKIDLIKLYVAPGILLSIIALIGWGIEFDFINTFKMYNRGRFILPGFKSILDNVNTFGSVIFISLFSAIFIYFSRKRINNKYLLASLFLFVFLLFSWARSSYLGFAVSFITLFIVKKSIRKRVVVLFLVILLLAGSLMLINKQVFDFFKAFMQLDKANTRIDINKASMQLLLKRPFFGYGQVDFGELIKPYLPPSFGDRTPGPHNIYFKTMLSTGIVGFAFYMMIIIITLKRAWWLINKGSEEARWLFCLIAGMVVHFYFETRSLGGLGYISLNFTFFLGYINYISYQNNKEYTSALTESQLPEGEVVS